MLPQEALDLYQSDKEGFVRNYVKKVSTLPPDDQAAVYWVAGLIEHFVKQPQNLDAALWNYEQGFAAAHEVGDNAGAAQNLAAIGCVQRVYGTKAASPEGKELDYKQARVTLHKAMELAREAGYTKGWMDAAGQLSLMMSSAEKYAFNAARLPAARELMPNSGALVDLLHTQAVAAVELGAKTADTTEKARFFDEAETFFQESFALTETLPATEDPEYKRIYDNIGYGEFLEQKNDPKALGYLQRGVEIARNYKEGTGNADALKQAERSRDAYLEKHPEIAAQFLHSTQNTY